MIHRSLLRLLIVIPFILALIALPLLFEPRRRSFSCKSFWSCVSLSSSYKEDNSAPLSALNDENLEASEAKLPDGTLRFTRRNPAHTPSTLVLVLTRDAGSWSRDYQSTQRSVYDFLDLLASTNLALSDVTLGFMTASTDEYRAIIKATEGVPLSKVTVLHRKDIGSGFVYEDRHHPEVQDQRRALLARLRNYLMNGALQDESHILWIDADVVELSPNIVQVMLAHAKNRADVGILTALCSRDTIYNYDMNAWRVAPTELDAAGSIDKNSLQDKLEHSKTWVPDLIQNTDDEDLVALDSVGGTLLYIRAELVRQGLIFPWWGVVGTGWQREGYVGLETEGLCYLSARMDGGGCFVLGGSHKTRHADVG